MEDTQIGGYASLMESAVKTDRPGVVRVEMADWAAVELAKLLRAIETIAAVSNRNR